MPGCSFKCAWGVKCGTWGIGWGVWGRRWGLQGTCITTTPRTLAHTCTISVMHWSERGRALHCMALHTLRSCKGGWVCDERACDPQKGNIIWPCLYCVGGGKRRSYSCMGGAHTPFPSLTGHPWVCSPGSLMGAGPRSYIPERHPRPCKDSRAP